jgi:hypothetical protein
MCPCKYQVDGDKRASRSFAAGRAFKVPPVERAGKIVDQVIGRGITRWIQRAVRNGANADIISSPCLDGRKTGRSGRPVLR